MIIQDRRRSFNSLTLILYRDGMFYFIAVAGKQQLSHDSRLWLQHL